MTKQRKKNRDHENKEYSEDGRKRQDRKATLNIKTGMRVTVAKQNRQIHSLFLSKDKKYENFTTWGRWDAQKYLHDLLCRKHCDRPIKTKYVPRSVLSP